MPDLSKFGRWEATADGAAFVLHADPAGTARELADTTNDVWVVYLYADSFASVASGTATDLADAKAQAEAAMIAPGGPLHEAVGPERVVVESCAECPFSGLSCALSDEADPLEADDERHPDCPLNTKPVLVTAGETT